MRVSAAGQITVPEELRRATGLEPGAEVVVRLRPEGGLIVEPEKPAPQPPTPTFSLEEIRAAAEELRRRGVRPRYTGDELMKLTREEPETFSPQPPRTLEELRRVVEDLHRRGICPDLSGDEVMKLTRGDD